MKILKLGTRGSKLALWQAEHVVGLLRKTVPDMAVEIKVIKTTGDRILDAPFSEIGDKGIFTKDIEQELQQGHIDLAVHSLKDVPSELEPHFCLAAILPRENPQDVLLSRRGQKMEELPEGAVLGTSSLRRISQLRAYRPDLRTTDLRGNVETRLKKMEQQNLDGIILAYAGVKRLGLENYISDYIPVDRIMPAAGQGAIALETCHDNHEINRLLACMNHLPTWNACRAERTFLSIIQGGCQAPVAAYAEEADGQITMQGLVASLDGGKVYRATAAGSRAEAERVGRELAYKLLSEGAREILAEIKAVQ